MKEVNDSSVQMAVTSPPYVTSKFKKGQPFDYEGYLDIIEDVFTEVYRVLCEDGRFCVNVGDVRTKYYWNDGRFYRLPVASHLLLKCIKVGFRPLDTFIWNKGFNRHMGGAAGPFFGSYPYPATIMNNVYWEYVFVLARPGRKRKVPKATKEMSRIPTDKWKEYTRDIWRVESETEWIRRHPSVFPVAIPRRFIEMYSFVGDTVLDPFLGSGTTTLAARMINRNSIGYEINPAYVELIRSRTGFAYNGVSNDTFELIKRNDASEGMWL